MYLDLDMIAARLMEQLRAAEHQYIGLQAQLALVNQLREEARRVAAADSPDPVHPNGSALAEATAAVSDASTESDARPHDGDRGDAHPV